MFLFTYTYTCHFSKNIVLHQVSMLEQFTSLAELLNILVKKTHNVFHSFSKQLFSIYQTEGYMYMENYMTCAE